MGRQLPTYEGRPLDADEMQDALIVYQNVLDSFGVGSKEALAVTEKIGDERFRRRALILDGLMEIPRTEEATTER